MRLWKHYRVWINGAPGRPYIWLTVFWTPWRGFRLKTISNRRRINWRIGNEWLWTGEREITVKMWMPKPPQGGSGVAPPIGKSGVSRPEGWGSIYPGPVEPSTPR